MTTLLKGFSAAALGLALLLAPDARAACKLQLVETLNVEVRDNVPIIKGTLNGQPIRILVATGTAKSFLLAEASDRLGLKRRRLEGVRMIGIAGASTAQIARVKELQFAGPPGKDFNLLVADIARGADFDFLLGQDVLARFDIEFDLANGLIKFFLPDDCADSHLAYWNADADWVPLASLEGRIDTIGKGDIEFWTELNGERMRTILNSSSSTSSVTLSAARRAGVTPETPGVTELRPITPAARKSIDQWGGVFERFAIGGESIQNARLRIADLYKYKRREEMPVESREPDKHVSLGGDFLQAHRVLVSSHQRRLYFTYRGGPVFQVRYQADGQEEEPAQGAAE